MTSHERQGIGSDSKSFGFKTSKDAIYEESAGRAIRLANRRKWTAIGALVILALVIIGGFAFNRTRTSAEKDVVKSYLSIDAEFMAEAQKFQEKVQAAKPEEIENMTPDFSASAEKFAAFAKENEAHPLGWQASFKAANIFLEAKKVDDALSVLEPLVKRTMGNALLQLKIRRALAGIYAEKKEYEKALAELDFIEKLPDNPAINEIKLFKAQVLYLSGNKEEAAKKLKELSDNALLAFDPSAKAISSEASMWLGYWGL